MSTRSALGQRRLVALGLAALLGACVEPEILGSDCAAQLGVCSRESGGAAGGSSGPQREPNLNPDAGTAIRSGRVARVDVLLVVDRSSSAAEERAGFAAQLEPLLAALLRGELDGGGRPEFLAVADLRVALVSSDLGAGMQSGNCSAEGDRAEPWLGGDSAVRDGACPTPEDGFFELTAVSDAAEVAGALQCMRDRFTRHEGPS